eukprot:g1527.t2
MMATTRSSSDDGGIQTLREHETNTNNSSILSQVVNVHPRSLRSPTPAHKQQQQQQQQQQQRRQQQQGKLGSISCAQNAQPITCSELQNSGPSSSSSCAMMVCNTAAKRPFFDTAASSSTAGRHDAQDLHSTSTSTFGSKAARTASSAPLSCPSPAAATNVTASPEDAGMYDPEALLLEPLLISPRSERQNIAGGGSGSSVCENVLQDDRIMSQSIGGGNGSGGGSAHLGSSSIIGSSRWESEVEVSAATSSSSMHMSSSSSSSSRPLVPASPSISGVQAGAPSFIPDQPLRGGRRAGPAAGGGGGGGNWYLDFPATQPTQVHQHHHAHFHHHTAGSTPAGQPTSAASLATAAANIAAEISQAAGNVAPSSFPTAGSSSYPPVEHGMRAAEDDMAYSAGGAGGGAGGGYDGYGAEDARHRTSSSPWSTASAGQQQQQQQRQQRQGVGSNSTVVDSSAGGGGYRHPRFVTREDCVPGSRFPRGGTNSGGGGSDAVEQGRAAAGLMHSYGLEVPFPRSEENDAMSVNVSGWQQPQQQHPSSAGAKRPHSQLGGANGSMPPSSASSSSSSAYNAEGPSSSSSSAPSVSTTQLAARLSPTMLSSHGHHGGKRMKVLGAADGSQGWANLPRNDPSSSSSGGWGSAGAGAPSANGTGMSVMVPGSMDTGGGGSSNGTATPSSGGSSRRRSVRGSTPAEANAAARAALAATFPPNPAADKDGDSGGGGDSSPDWTERDESEEEEASPVPASTSKGGGGGGKAKIPFMLDPKLWTIVERRAICTAKQCAYRSEDDHRARRRHYHALCSHVHQNGERKGMRFQHHQLEKVQKHQRAHQNTQRSSAGKPRSPCSSPIPRSKRTSATNGQKEQTRAIKDANVEAHSPKDWTPELTRRLRELVDELGPKWSLIAEKIPGKTATACMLHWRVGLNPNHMVKGSGTWTAEEDERLSKLVEVVGMKVPRNGDTIAK